MHIFSNTVSEAADLGPGPWGDGRTQNLSDRCGPLLRLLLRVMSRPWGDHPGEGLCVTTESELVWFGVLLLISIARFTQQLFETHVCAVGGRKCGGGSSP